MVKQYARPAATSHRLSRVTRIGVPMALAAFAGTGLVASAAPAPTPVSSVRPSVSLTSPADLSQRVEPNSRGLSAARPALSAAAQAERARKAKAAAQVEAKAAAQVKAKAAAKAKAKAAAQAKARAAARAEAARAQARARTVAAERTKLAALPLKVVGTRYATAALTVRVLPEKSARSATVVAASSRLSVTGTVRAGYRLVSVRGQRRWVTDTYLTTKKPAARTVTKAASRAKAAATTSGATTSGGGISAAACAGGSGMESGLTSDAVKVHRALCARFPQVSAFGGLRGGGGNHGSGRAVDAMISNSSVGHQMASWLRAHARQLGISEVIYSQRIWTVQRSGEGWRSMSDRGSATANHYDHVHISVYGSSATS